MNLTEFGRAVHAEAEAIIAAARTGAIVRRGSLYVTTFPCHVCAKQIVAAGISEVTYIEPYPKSMATDLHEDSVRIDGESQNRVRFKPFVGVAPRCFPRLFSMVSPEGLERRRKDPMGYTIKGKQQLRLQMPYFSALERERLVAEELQRLTEERGSDNG